MGDNVLTFEQLREIQRNEKNEDMLQSLGEDFFKRVRDYLERKKRIDTFESDKEHRNARHIVEDIIDRRQKKILRLSFLSTKSNLSVDNLHPEEKPLFEHVQEKIEAHQEKLKKEIGEIDGSDERKGAKEDLTKKTGKEEEEAEEEEENSGKKAREEDSKAEDRKDSEVPEGYTRVEVKEDIKEFMGTDMKSYGPFQSGEIELLPDGSIEALERQGKVERVN